MSENLYDQPVKKRVRDQILAHAVRSLTAEREQAPLVSEEAFLRTLDYACRFVKQVTGQDIKQVVKPFVDEYWLPIYLSRVSSRSPTDLQVLMLSGPNPLNDIIALSELGVPPHNVWAVEADRDEYEKAVQSLGESRLPIRLYCGSLQEFFAVVPQQFDIIYFDSCGPLLGGKPQTLPVLRELFVNQRLSPTSALITNFCAANMEGNASRKWAKRMMTWYAARYDEPHYFSDLVAERAESHRMSNDDDNPYLEHVEAHLADYYSDFVSRFIIEFASHLLPWWRILALPGAKKEFFARPENLIAAVEASVRTPEKLNPGKLFDGFGHVMLSPESYPYVWSTRIAKELLEPADPFRILLTDDAVRSAKLGDAIKVVSLVRKFFESNVEWGQHNKDACSEDFARVLSEFAWFDSEGQPWHRMFCDDPMPNLIADLCFGQAGYPYHANAERQLRLSYTAKDTPMLTDVFIFDQARYLYDLVPSPSLLGKELPFPMQIVLRVCMDAVRRHAHVNCPQLFWACALASFGEDGFSVNDWPERTLIT